MSDLSAAYDRLSHRCTREQLADDYRRARRFGEEPPGREQGVPIRRPIAMLASAVPACATLSVAIHMIHVLPDPAEPGLLDQLLGNAEKHAAIALDRCHRALEMDARAHDYRADDWLPAVYDIAGALLQAARLEQEPPSLVEHAQEAVRWISRAIIELEHDTPDSAAALADGLGRMLVTYVFTDVARTLPAEPGA